MKKILLAAALAVGFAVTGPLPANADVNVRIHLGVPHYTYQVGPDYVYRKNYGWYRGKGSRISCDRARSIVRNSGYRNVDRVECGGATYTFRATRNGKRQLIYVNSRTGGMWRG